MWVTLSSPTAPLRAVHRPKHHLRGKTLSLSQEGRRKEVSRLHTAAQQLCRVLFSLDKGQGPWTATALRTPVLALPQAVGVTVQALEQNTLQGGEEKGGKDAFPCHQTEVYPFSYLQYPNA